MFYCASKCHQVVQSLTILQIVKAYTLANRVTLFTTVFLNTKEMKALCNYHLDPRKD